MKLLTNLLISKKAKMVLAGALVEILIAVGLPVTLDMQELVMKIVAGLFAAYILIQGLADGMSKGATSSTEVAKPKMKREKKKKVRVSLNV